MDLTYFERSLRALGYKYIGGVDEAGRGPLVGPVVSACVVLPVNFKAPGLTDSKQLTKKQRDYYYDLIQAQALGIGIGIITAKRIDEVNIYEATKEAMLLACNNINCPLEYVLIDYMPLELKIPHQALIKGDSCSLSIAAASVIAKVTRDRILIELDQKYPQYGFKQHKGYPTKGHLQALKKYGIVNEYRLSYKPVQKIIKEKEQQRQNIIKEEKRV